MIISQCVYIRFMASAASFAGALCLCQSSTAAVPNERIESSGQLFEEISPKTTGVNFVHRLVLEHRLAYLYDSGYACGGVALGDVNGDGKPDILLTSGPDDNVLFLNKGGFVFEKSPASQVLDDAGVWGVSAAMADVDGDGDLDIFICNYNSPNRLFLNDGQGQFKECGAQAGLAFTGPSQCAYFADFDGDGDLDLFLLTNRLYSPRGRPRTVTSELGPDGQPRVKSEFSTFFRVVQPDKEVPPDQAATTSAAPKPFLIEFGHPDRLYRNDGPSLDGTPRFTDVTRGSGLEEVAGHGLSALIWDINHDGRPDIYVANDYTDGDRLWLNVGSRPNGSFKFRDATDEFLPYTTWSSMGSDIADVNGDGRLDFLVADMASTTHFKAQRTMTEISGWRRWVLENGWPRQAMRNMLFLDSGAGRFEEAGFLAGVARSDWTWSVNFGDFDLDGRPDAFMATGAARAFNDADYVLGPMTTVGRTEWDFFKDKSEGRERNMAFRNEGGLRFTDVSRAWNLDNNSMSYAAASGDLDGDGDLDLVVCNLTENVSLYRNRAAETGAHWLKVRLEGEKNRLGLGAMVMARLRDGSPLVRLMNPYTGFLSGNEPALHFGLGGEKQIASLEVRWPGGKTQLLGPQSADQLLVVREAEGSKRKSELAAATNNETGAAQFVEVAEKIGLRFRHKEKPFDDYRREPLLPGKLSQFGPGIAVSDVNGDGLDDVFVGGAAEQVGGLFIHQPDHTFRPMQNPPWGIHADTEDMGALFFDADRDGDMDIYIASGSNEWESENPHYADHLYLNQTKSGGPISFSEALPGALPDIRQSGSCVVGADFDRDGDVDLFIGARSVPGSYVVIPESVLLRNDNTKPGEVKFSDATDSITPDLQRIGLVTAALWSDVDGDGWADLLVTSEWGPVSLFLNRAGKLTNITEQAGLAGRLGWWNSIVGADFDGDGDIDYAVLNVGLNTKYGQPTPQKPVVLYRNDMDGDGVADLIEARTSAGSEWPERGRSSSSLVMPFLRARFQSYRAFASANLADIYGAERLARSTRASATEFASGLLLNESSLGHPRFIWKPLPNQAQVSPCFGAVAMDFFGDGRPSLALAQNLFTREPQTGLWSGGLGAMLRPAGNELAAEECARTGFIVTGDAKGLASTDLDGDGWPDLLVTRNNDPLLAFKNRSQRTRGPLVIRLQGLAGNPQGFGARVRLFAEDKLLGTTELYAGSGYLSQSSSVAFFLRPTSEPTVAIEVRWPTGELSRLPIGANQTSLSVRIAQPPALSEREQ